MYSSYLYVGVFSLWEGKMPRWRSLLERFMESVRSDWQWIGNKNNKGYGQITIDHKHKLAHRVSYEFFNGPIPDGMCVLHSCDDPGCVNPEHLHLGDKHMNTQESIARGRHISGFVRVRQLTGKWARSGLSKDQAIEIRELYKTGKYNQSELGRKLGISRNTIHMIVNNKAYKDML